jgi:hypothetical protein
MGTRRLAAAAGALAALTLAAPAAAQERPRPPPNVITTNPLAALLGGTANLEYERAVHPYVGVFAGPQIQFGYGLLFRGSEGDSVFGLGLTTGARFYLFGEAPRGFFLSPQLEVAYVSLTTASGSGSGSGFGVSALVGYQWLIADHFVISIGGGVRYMEVSATASSGSSTASASLSGFGPAARLALGGAF